MAVSKEEFLNNFKSFDTPKVNSDVLDKIEKSRDELNKLEFPTQRSEKWKYTRVNKILNSKFSPNASGPKPILDSVKVNGFNANMIVLVNGCIDRELSQVDQQEGVSISEIHETLAANEDLTSYLGAGVDTNSDIFTALNTSFMSNGVSVEVKKNVKAEKPLHLIVVSNTEDVVQQPRNLFKLQPGAELEVLITFVSQGEGKSFVNSVSEVFLDRNSSLTCHVIEDINDKSFLINEFGGIQRDDTKFQLNTFSVKGNWIRNNVGVKVDGSNAECNLYGAYLPKEKEHVDNHTIIDHLKPHSESNELYKGIMSDQSTAVFNGKVFVREDAQKTNAFQQNSNIVLHDTASVNSKPELEIYADDVKCSHGSTTGQFDLDALYYLQTRGISADKAKRMLTSAFVSEVVDIIENEDLKAHISDLMNI